MDHAGIIDALGGYAALADTLGLPSGTVSSMKSRNSIPPDLWAAVAEAATKQGKPHFTVEYLASTRASRRKRPTPAEAAS